MHIIDRLILYFKAIAKLQ